MLRTPTPPISKCQWSSTEDKQGKGLSTTPTLVPQTNQNNLEERKAVWKVPDRTLTEAGSNDDLITELEFTEAISGLSKGTAPGSDKVKYSDIKNPVSRYKSELFSLYEESFATVQVPEDQLPQAYPQTGEGA